MKPAGAHHSLQWRLSAALLAVILLTGAVAGILSFVWALHDANEILDGTLHDTAGLIVGGQISMPQRLAQLAGSEPDDDVLVIPLRAGEPGIAGQLAGLAEGLHTVKWDGRSWRVLVSTAPNGARLAVAQQTQVRDEIAQHSAARTLIPLLLLMPVLIVLVRQVVARTLRPVTRLARHVDTHAMANAANLPDLDIPSEIEPFVRSIKRLLAELTGALAHQQRFVANAAHELRSPMAALQLQVANVERVLPEGPARERLASLQSGIVRMQHLLEQLLSMARSEAPAAREMAPVPLAEMAKEVIATLVSQAQAKGVDLGMERCEPGVCVQGTPMDLATLLHNVTENAVKYCACGAVVTLSVYAEQDDAVIVVVDNGPGIAAEHLSRVFEPFYRVAPAGESGSGLGLSIVAAIAKRLGGRLTLTSEGPGKGVKLEYRQLRTACQQS
ncbi:MAG: qseC4 [Ramlibacter sp.]|nr:qseC4 [Ramlibacter sp.]